MARFALEYGLAVAKMLHATALERRKMPTAVVAINFGDSLTYDANRVGAIGPNAMPIPFTVYNRIQHYGLETAVRCVLGYASTSHLITSLSSVTN